MTKSAEIETIAADWLRRREEPEWSSADQVALDQWLKLSTAHQAAYWRLEHGWRIADRIGALGPEISRPFSLAASLQTRWKRSRTAAVAAVVFALVAGSALWFHQRSDGVVATASFVTPVGGRGSIPLADGSRIELNTDTRLHTSVSKSERKVWLDRGEAYFDVAHRADEPFVVYAGTQTITVLGTKFSVRRDGDMVQVAVLEGRVRIDKDEGIERPRPAIVSRGDIALSRGEATLVTAHALGRVEDGLAWRDGRLVFDRMTIADAAAEFNRYSRIHIVIVDPVVADIRIGGSFQASNVDAFVRLLEDAYGLDVRREDSSIIISAG